MPFTSKSQLRTCYFRQGRNSNRKNPKKGWNCNEFLSATNSVCCLPEKKGLPTKSRCMKNGERVVGKIQTGSRSGRYFIIKEKDRTGLICEMKVYLPRTDIKEKPTTKNKKPQTRK